MSNRRAIPALLLFLVPLGLAFTRGGSSAATADLSPATVGEAQEAPSEAVYMVYYWRARPGHESEYAAYIRDVAEPIDARAREAGVFEWVRTYTPALKTGAEGADWTHMRVFKLANYAALDGFSAGLNAATREIYPGPATQPSSAGMRDLVRQEIWRDFQ